MYALSRVIAMCAIPDRHANSIASSKPIEDSFGGRKGDGGFAFRVRLGTMSVMNKRVVRLRRIEPNNQ